MRRAVKILVAATLAISMMGASDPGCEERKADRSERPNQRVEPSRERRVTIRTHGNGPYTVTRLVTGPGKGGRQTTERNVREVAHGEYEAGVSYTTGTRLNVKVQVEGHAADLFDCEIIDAGVKGNRSYDRGKAQAYCEIWTHG